MLSVIGKLSWLLPLVLLAGCQQPVNKTIQPTVQQQIKQLSALVAGAHYLQKNCQQMDVPDEAVLVKTALNLAVSRNWDINVPAYKLLEEQSQERYQALVKESDAEKPLCPELNLLMVDFVDEAQRNIG
ncbi:type II secretion system pilot lipoprotein GspS [Yersinia sp. Marseille-Q3913]|uniref:type II secretion system pilot lipoprotein GspS n=1 Tax=Yersinia sp. Marseille-Q3913 TaxID=2830769 RepID=UPI001BB0A75B|nr:type II secretion system pilot lipoprotein GspS [Yersinia sp. Marseille-Q3913]MBS0056553.1 type II secretion system pilot lipoprotein GspS [Yersinia sp. Marseille-Q3913]